MASFAKRIHRKRRQNVSHEYEDRGLFIGELHRLKVEVTPEMSKNGRSDHVVDGIINGDSPITLIFEGRRRLQIAPLISRLKEVEREFAKSIKKQSSTFDDHSFPLSDVRLPILTGGAWRMHFEMDEEGFHKKFRQFVVSRWAFDTLRGDTRIFAEAPEHLPPTD